MTNPAYLKCPGSDPIINAVPEFFLCLACDTDIEIWTDEQGGKCPSCRTYYKKKRLAKRAGPGSVNQEEKGAGLHKLMETATLSGATQVASLSAREIIIDDFLADRCKEPRCENYGLSKSCPPHVSGPSGLKKLLVTYRDVIFFKIDVPAEALYSSERRGIFGLLHEIASGIEQAAREMGFTRASAFAGGSCKKIFCHDQPKCPALSEVGICRHPQTARPSMSGFGIHLPRLMESAGWAPTGSRQDSDSTDPPMEHVCGLVLID